MKALVDITADVFPMPGYNHSASWCRAAPGLAGSGADIAVGFASCSSDNRLAPCGLQAADQIFHACFQRSFVRRTDDEIRPELAVADEGVGPDLAMLVRPLDLAQQVGNLALGGPAADGAGEQRSAALQLVVERLQHRRRDVR